LEFTKAFASVLIPDMDQPQKTAEFADMYAQTIVYGLSQLDVTKKALKPSKVRSSKGNP
jgi:hypothetical protein